MNIFVLYVVKAFCNGYVVQNILACCFWHEDYYRNAHTGTDTYIYINTEEKNSVFFQGGVVGSTLFLQLLLRHEFIIEDVF